MAMFLEAAVLEAMLNFVCVLHFTEVGMFILILAVRQVVDCV